MKDKIVFVLPSLNTGGGNRVLIELANQLVRDDYEVDIVYPNKPANTNTFYADRRVRFTGIGAAGNSRASRLINVIKIFKHINKSYRSRKIVFTDPIMAIFLVLARCDDIYRFIQADDYCIFDDLAILRSRLLLAVYKWLAKRSYSYDVKYLFNSRYTYERFVSVSRRLDTKFNLIHPAVDCNVFFNRNIREENVTNICIVGRRHPWKGFVDFIKPLNDGSISKVDNIFVLSHDDLSDFDLSKVKLIVPKNDEEIAYYLNISHIFVSTSWWEGFGLPQLEAMACGCAVLLTNAGGVNEYSIPGRNCLMIEPKSQKMLVESLNRLIADKALRQDLSKNAQVTAKTFSWQKSAEQLLDVLYAT